MIKYNYRPYDSGKKKYGVNTLDKGDSKKDKEEKEETSLITV